MLVYSRSIKIRASGFSELLESIFCILLVMEAFSLQTVVKILQVVVGWQEVRWMWWMRHNFVANSSNLWKAGCEVVPLGGGVEKNGARSAHQCWLQVLQFSVHLICRACFSDVMLLLGFRKLQSDWQQTTKRWQRTFFFLVQVWLWKVLWSCFLVQPLSWSSLVVV